MSFEHTNIEDRFEIPMNFGIELENHPNIERNTYRKLRHKSVKKGINPGNAFSIDYHIRFARSLESIKDYTNTTPISSLIKNHINLKTMLFCEFAYINSARIYHRSEWYTFCKEYRKGTK